jgi:hypothetical protein
LRDVEHMNIYYLLGIPFDSYADHQQLIHIYKKGNARIELASPESVEFTIHHEIHA